MEISLSGDLTIATAAERKNEILGFMDANEDVLLDLSSLDEFDCAGLQLLLLLHREASGKNLGVLIKEDEKAACRIIKLFQLDKLLKSNKDDT